MSTLRTIFLFFLSAACIFLGIRDGIIGRHLKVRRAMLVGDEAHRQGVIMVVFGLMIMIWCGYMLWREFEERRS